jgi:hypothetical protein
VALFSYVKFCHSFVTALDILGNTRYIMADVFAGGCTCWWTSFSGLFGN